MSEVDTPAKENGQTVDVKNFEQITGRNSSLDGRDRRNSPDEPPDRRTLPSDRGLTEVDTPSHSPPSVSKGV